MTEVVKPYNIDVPQAKIDRLKQKLALADLPPEVDGDKPWARGVALEDLKRILDHWINQYDWRKTEKKLNNMLPQFTTPITVDGFGTYNVHFVHQQSKVKNAIPLLFMHGWPGNFTEVEKILPLLIAGDGKEVPAFHVVAPSLIDFGFSDRSGKHGFNVTQHGHACHKLMLRLGYEKYVIQGGDLGAFIARAMVQHYQSSIGGHLLNLVPATEPKKEEFPDLWERIQKTPLTDAEKYGLNKQEQMSKEGMGYYRIQATKPQTIGYSMADSPVGLLAWIYEKMHDWTDEYPWSEEEVLQWASIYYFSTPGPSATQQIYYEAGVNPDSPPGTAYSSVPLGVSRFPEELMQRPRLWHEALGPVVFWSEHKKGGHFAAWEVPEDLVSDIQEMFGRGGGAAGCCGKERSGYEVEIDRQEQRSRI